MSASPASPTPPASTATAATHGDTQGLIRLLTAGAGISVACIYLNHPLLGLISRDLAIAPHALGVLPTLTAAGYASGIFFFGPLGDRYDRRLVILWKAVLLTLALIGSCLAPNLPLLAASGFVIGLSATIAQDFVPSAAAISTDLNRNRNIGTVMTGLLIGIVSSRVFSGIVADHFGIDPALVKAVIAAESGFNPQAVSPKGAIGLMQVIPDTGARYGVTGDARRTAAQKLADPKINITTGVRYLSDLLRMFSGNLELVLAAYNAGEGAVQKHGNDIPPYAETQNYVKTVMQFYRYYNPMAEMNGAGGFMTVSANGAMVTRKPGRTGRSARIEVVLDPATGVVTNAQQH